MIYRVELRKDGAVGSCGEVESQYKDGGLVFYVEAKTKEEAIGIAKKRWERLRMLGEEARKAQAA